MAKTKDFFGYDTDQKPASTGGGGESPSGFLEGLRGSAAQAAIFDQMMSPNATPLAGCMVERTIGGGTLATGTAGNVIYDKQSWSFGRDAPVPAWDASLGNPSYTYGIRTQTKGLYLAYFQWASNVIGLPTGYLEMYGYLASEGTLGVRRPDTLVNYVNAGGNAFYRGNTVYLFSIKKGEEVRFWTVNQTSGTLNIETNTAFGIQYAMALIRIANL